MAPMLEDRHPDALGRAFFAVWPEVREELTPLFDAVRRGGHMRTCRWSLIDQDAHAKRVSRSDIRL
jgi:hypothetical protein